MLPVPVVKRSLLKGSNGQKTQVVNVILFNRIPSTYPFESIRFTSTKSTHEKTEPSPDVNSQTKSNTTLQNKVQKPSLWTRIKKEASHYWDGTKLLGFEMKISYKLVTKMLAGHSLTRRERIQVKRTTRDVVRLVPFAAFVLIPFAELLLPVALKLFPNLLPSTYESKKDKQSKLESLRKTRELVAEVIKENKSHFKPSNITEEQKQIFNDFYKHVRENGEPESRQQLIQVAWLYTDDTVLDNLTRPYLVALAKYMNIQPFGTDVILRYRIRYKMLELKKDDFSIYYEDAEQLNSQELRSACASRGIRIKDVNDSVLRENLRVWLNMRLKDKIPSTLLIMATSYNYGAASSKRSLYDSLCDVLTALPDELYHEVKVNVVRKDNASPKQKLEQLKEQEEIMKEEEEQEENAKVRINDQLSLDDIDKQQEDATKSINPQQQQQQQQQSK